MAEHHISQNNMQRNWFLWSNIYAVYILLNRGGRLYCLKTRHMFIFLFIRLNNHGVIHYSEQSTAYEYQKDRFVQGVAHERSDSWRCEKQQHPSKWKPPFWNISIHMCNNNLSCMLFTAYFVLYSFKKQFIVDSGLIQCALCLQSTFAQGFVWCW